MQGIAGAFVQQVQHRRTLKACEQARHKSCSHWQIGTPEWPQPECLNCCMLWPVPMGPPNRPAHGNASVGANLLMHYNSGPGMSSEVELAQKSGQVTIQASLHSFFLHSKAVMFDALE